ncbi:MAG: DASS family sodium-coupled anion symporter [Planctomycetes bacterium]|nr:DASS family sodium-coupled anion symporter [Planctomycetota bacterium]NOG56019.1 DASS family sodium-coupled anion symporter [Planctomycetota bacterium]
MIGLETVRQWARENRDPSIFEVLRHTHWWSIFIVALGPVLAAITFRLAEDHIAESVLGGDAKVMLAIFVLTATYWVTGAIPPFATGILAIGLSVFLVGLPAHGNGQPDILGHTTVDSWKDFVGVAAAPIIILMFGGFVLSAAAHKHGLDRVMAVTFLKPFGSRRPIVLLGMMLITANFSMWMSNTATAAFMITLIAPLLDKSDPNSPARRSFTLAIPLAANIGGIGTPIGTPPNAIAFGALHAMGIEITFFQWMLFAIPVVLIMLVIAWLLLLWWYPFKKDHFQIEWSEHVESPGWRQWIVYLTFFVTIGLWMTSTWTGIPIAPVAIIPVMVFTATRLVDRNDINNLDWDILLLMAGGLALGAGMSATGLAEWMVESVPLDSLGQSGMVVVLCGATMLMSTFMSNTAVANLLMPIALGLAAVGAADAVVGGNASSLTPLAAGVSVALGASLAMALPVSTPPNAIAFSTGRIQVSDMVRLGIMIGVIGVLLTTVLCRIAF